MWKRNLFSSAIKHFILNYFFFPNCMPVNAAKRKQTQLGSFFVKTSSAAAGMTTTDTPSAKRTRGRPRKVINMTGKAKLAPQESPNPSPPPPPSTEAPAPPVKRKRGRPRKNPDEPPTPRTPSKRGGRGGKSRTPTTPKRTKSPAKRPRTGGSGRRQSASDSEASGESPESPPNGEVASPPKQRKEGYTYQKKRRNESDRWSGPQEADHKVNPHALDVGLNLQTWDQLRRMRVHRHVVEVVTDPAVQASYRPATDPIKVSMRTKDDTLLADMELGSLDIQELVGSTPGWIINTGQPGVSVDWAPNDYIAVGSSSNADQIIDEREKDKRPGAIQIYRVVIAETGERSCKLDMLLVHNFGRCIMARWCPISIDSSSASSEEIPVVSYLAAIFGDGHLRVCAVPASGPLRNESTDTVSPIYVRWPDCGLLNVRASQGIFTSLVWAGCDMIVAGSSKGSISAWSLDNSIRYSFSHCSTPWPYTYTPKETTVPASNAPVANHRQHQSAICSLDIQFSKLVESMEEPNQTMFKQVHIGSIIIYSSGLDNRMRQTLLAFPSHLGYPLITSTPASSALCLAWTLNTLVFMDADNRLRVFEHPLLGEKSGNPWIKQLSGSSQIRQGRGSNQKQTLTSRTIYNLTSDAHEISLSDHHTYLAVASSEGSLTIQNTTFGKSFDKANPHYRRIYTLLWDESTRSLVCLDRSDMETSRITGGQKKKEADKLMIYPLQVGVRACAWSRNPDSKDWIASIGVSGLLRIEDVSN